MDSPRWLQSLLEDESITDITLNGGESVFVDRGQGMQVLSAEEFQKNQFTEENLRHWVLARLSDAGKSWDARHPFADATLKTGHRLHVVFPPLCSCGLAVSIRRLSRKTSRCFWSTEKSYPLLAQAVQRGESILISGSTGSGKTTLLRELLGEVPAHERIIALEDTPELSPNHPHFLSLLSRPPNSDGFGEVSLSSLLRQALRMRPDRILLGECRGAEVLDVLQSLNTGHRGTLATLHANSARDALRRVELLCLLAAKGTISSSLIRDLIAAGVQWVVHVARVDGQRRITEILRIEGKEGDVILLRALTGK